MVCCGEQRDPVRYLLKMPGIRGEERIFLTETEARVAQTEAGGGTITRINRPTGR